MTQVAVKERGIGFVAEHVPKVLDGTKTMTRRTWGLEFVNQDPDAFEFLRMEGDLAVFQLALPPKPFNISGISVPSRSYPRVERTDSKLLFYIKCPYGQVGDGLWLKETYSIDDCRGDDDYGHYGPVVYYKATDSADCGQPWRSPRFMPRTASRKDMVITELRAERLQSISWQACKREGADPQKMPFSVFEEPWKVAFERLWDSINAPRGYSFESNPWVWPIGWKV